MQFYSQYGQDRFLVEKVFKNKKNGYFLDVGAYDGVNLSNTFFLESVLGWKGICVEPNPLVYEQLKVNRSCIALNCCINDKVDIVKFLSVSGWGVMLSGILEFFDKRHLMRIDRAIEEHGGEKRLIEIPALPLQYIFKEHKLKTIDYCNIDVEGGEMQVLKSIDFSNIDIKVFTIENNFGTKAVREFLKPLGYSLIAKIGADEVYEKDSKRYILKLKFRLKMMKNYLHRIKQNIARIFN